MHAEPSAGGRFLLFAKGPVAGRAKTRMEPALDPQQAAAVARVLLGQAAKALCHVPPGWSVGVCADDPADPVLQGLASRHGYAMTEQGGGDLGARMARASRTALAEYPAVIVVGSDCMGFDPAYLRAAADALADGNDAVLGPAQDGGYVLVGLSRSHPQVFEGIAWGGGGVAEAQRARFRALGFNWRELPVRADVDRPEDLWMLCPAMPRPVFRPW